MCDSGYEVEEEFLAIGRTFAEYSRLFDLEVADLARARVLDCGGGAGSFTATAAAVGADPTAVDPMYGPPADALEPGLADAVETTERQLREKADLFVWEEYADVATRIRYLRAASQRFLADYADNPERYVAGGLPELPFDDDAFDLALSANFLFLYDDRLDADFHVESVRELARVADEVRIFPLVSLDTTRSNYVDPVVEACRADGLAVECRAVPYEFRGDETKQLVVSGG